MNASLIPQRPTKRALAALLLHAVVFAFVYWFAYNLRTEFGVAGFRPDAGSATQVGAGAQAVSQWSPLEQDWITLWFTLPGIVLIKLIVFYYLGHCHRSWYNVSFSDLVALFNAANLSTLLILAINGLLVIRLHPSRSVLLIDWALTILVLGGLRALWRLSREELSPRVRRDYRKALIVGANQSGETLARHLLSDRRLKYQPVGYLDRDEARIGSTLGGIPVWGHPNNASRIAVRLGVADVLTISGVLTGPQLRSLMEDCAQAGITLKVIPAYDDLLAATYSPQIRNVDIDDLLRREPVQLNSDAIGTLVGGRTILVTGAGGSIGSEICRQVLKFRPKALVLVEQAENSLFMVEQEFRALRTEAHIIPCIADITDRSRMDQVLKQYRPAIVFHAAAHKHVPMMEYNPGEAIKNNVLGTRLLAELADEHGVQEFVMISTDKAVNPTSIMGVSKQLAERFVHAYSEKAGTKFVVVRFGNVLASNGSVVPIFQEQIRRGGPITVTHPEIERYFMTIPEASQLVLQAAAMGKGGEIFVLDMGESVRIVDLAHDLIRLSGLEEGDIEIVFTGLRPGEKLYEELYFDDEERQPTPHPKLFVAYHRPYTLAEVERAIAEVATLMHAAPEVLRLKIKELVAEYSEPCATRVPADRRPESAAPADGRDSARSPGTSTSQSSPVAESNS